ncbi:hypothetical protein NQ317_019155 [Molorchus minor]|uniref:GST N-terminal domain-containing protein n=1 Tax=Molorchus minor TaxID=1323400 RepID=A0ABQ9JQR9_9CUCU|nr:hypothetical protein NQ317_019155 [Molorchus minor]
MLQIREGGKRSLTNEKAGVLVEGISFFRCRFVLAMVLTKVAAKIYGTKGSPAVRATLMTVKALGIEVERDEVNIAKGEQFLPSFLKLNPLHTIPVLEEGNFVLWDSHAVNTYLADKYGKDDSLYPKHLEKRAAVDSRLYFNCGVLFPSFRLTAVPFFTKPSASVSEKSIKSLSQGFQRDLTVTRNKYSTN